MNENRRHLFGKCSRCTYTSTISSRVDLHIHHTNQRSWAKTAHACHSRDTPTQFTKPCPNNCHFEKANFRKKRLSWRPPCAAAWRCRWLRLGMLACLLPIFTVAKPPPKNSTCSGVGEPSKKVPKLKNFIFFGYCSHDNVGHASRILQSLFACIMGHYRSF